MVPLLAFVDNLTLLLILQKWGQRNYNPEPKDIVHFDVIEQLLKALCQWPFQVRLVKIKSHTCCLLNERSDKQVEIGYSNEDPEAFPGPCIPVNQSPPPGPNLSTRGLNLHPA